MEANGFGNNLDERRRANDISKENIGDKKGDEEKYNVFKRFFKELIPAEGRLVQFFLFKVIAFDPVFYFAENHFQEYRLRTSPATEYPAEYNGKEYDEYNEGEQAQYKEVEILRPENDAKEHKLSLQHIEQNQLLAI